jgi:hypothetical protein
MAVYAIFGFLLLGFSAILGFATGFKSAAAAIYSGFGMLTGLGLLMLAEFKQWQRDAGPHQKSA